MTFGKSRRATTLTKRQSVVTQHSAQPLQYAIGVHWGRGAKRVVARKVRGVSPERWELEADYDMWEEI